MLLSFLKTLTKFVTGLIKQFTPNLLKTYSRHAYPISLCNEEVSATELMYTQRYTKCKVVILTG